MNNEIVTIFIRQMLQQLPPFAPERSIFRVPKPLLNMNHRAYVPEVISIGPFHHDQQAFKATEELKLRFFNSYQCRVNMSIRGIIEIARSWEERARNHYSDPINMSSDDFIKMMLLDGCFVVEFMIVDCRTFAPTENMVNNSFYQAIKHDLCQDLLLLENQLPFFVLEALFKKALPLPTNETPIMPFEDVVHKFLQRWALPVQVPYKKSNEKPHHLVDFLSFYFVPLANENQACKNRSPPTATKLSEAGVVFKKAEECVHIMDISFIDGVLKIPPFPIYDNFETYVRNLMAFEQFPVVYSEKKNEELHSKKYAIQYLEFLDNLLNTEKDVSLLVKAEIITNNIGGSDKEISELFNGLCKNVILDGSDDYFSKVSKDLNEHCKKRRNRWKDSLKRNYFNTPWAFISFLAATFLIVLTLLQTIFSAVSISK